MLYITGYPRDSCWAMLAAAFASSPRGFCVAHLFLRFYKIGNHRPCLWGIFRADKLGSPPPPQLTVPDLAAAHRYIQLGFETFPLCFWVGLMFWCFQSTCFWRKQTIVGQWSSWNFSNLCSWLVFSHSTDSSFWRMIQQSWHLLSSSRFIHLE